MSSSKAPIPSSSEQRAEEQPVITDLSQQVAMMHATEIRMPEFQQGQPPQPAPMTAHPPPQDTPFPHPAAIPIHPAQREPFVLAQWGQEERDRNRAREAQLEEILVAMRKDNEAQMAAMKEELLKQFQPNPVEDETTLESLCLFPDIQLPAKFQCPELHSFDGTGCPLIHLRSYVGDMCQYAKDERIMVQFFQRSLTGAAHSWFISLDKQKVKAWKDLAAVFIQQYRLNSQMVQTRAELQRLSKRNSESVRDYAKRWMELANVVQPPLLEQEQTSLFMSSLGQPYFTMLLGQCTTSFTDLVMAAVRIEDAVKMEKLEGPMASLLHGTISSGKRQGNDGGASTVNYVQPSVPFHISSSRSVSLPSTNNAMSRLRRRLTKEERKNREFTQLPYTLAELLPTLLREGHLQLATPNPKASKMNGYDPSKSCEYHMGVQGHDTNGCWGLRHAVQDLLEAGELKIDPPSD